MTITAVTKFVQDGTRREIDALFMGSGAAEGGRWAQFDTDQDAWYYGCWVNPFDRKFVSFVEGDLTTEVCDTDEEFVRMLDHHVVWNLENQDRPARIDCWMVQKLIDRFHELGFQEGPQT